MDPRKHYKILEIERSASLEEARQAYRDLIAVWHPDRYAHNPRLQKKALEKVKTVNAAFEFVSRFIIENGSGVENPSGTHNRPAPAASRKKNTVADTGDREAVWEKTESRLAAMARAKELAQAREAARTREAAKLAAAEKKRRAASKESRRDVQNQARKQAREDAERARLEKKLDRERAWAETEQKLRALKLAREKAALACTGNPAEDKKGRATVGWYMKQVLICSGILLVVFSGNALQTFVHVTFTVMLTMIGGSFLAWWVAAKVIGKRCLKRKND